MADRLGLFHVAHAGAGELYPLGAGFFPVERRFPAVSLHGFPAVREPELRAGIARVFHECQILAAGRQAHGKAERAQKNFVPRPFIVKVKRFAFRADLIEAFRIKLLLLLRRAFSRPCSDCRLVHRMQRVAPESMLDIGNDQLLVLLLMVQPEDHKFLRFCGDRTGLQQLEHLLVDVSAILADFLQAGTRKGIAQRFFRLLAYSVVIRIKEIAKLRMERPISGQMIGKNESLKEPTCVCHVPFGWAGLRTRLHH